MAARGPSLSGQELSPGHLLVGKYLIDRVLGRGGVGIVLAATHLALDQKVAIKVLRSDTKLTVETIERFLREARAAAMIRSEHVTRVYDVGTSEEGYPYIVMEHLDGRDLGDLLESGPLSVEDVVEYVLQVCLALAEAHRVGIVHRDLKPANLFLTHRSDGLPVIKILDFGISKVVPKTPRGSNAEFVTTTQIMGSPEYMSPEQMRSTKDVDARTDIWALGVVMYELLTGHPAFTADTVQQLFHVIERTEPRPLESFRRDVPDILKEVIARCLKKDRDARFSDVGELASALRLVASARAEALVDAVIGTLHGAASAPKPKVVVSVSGPPLAPMLLTTKASKAKRASAPTVDGVTGIGPTPFLRTRGAIGLGVALVVAGGLIAMLVLGASAGGPGSGRSGSGASAAPPVPVTAAPSPTPPATPDPTVTAPTPPPTTTAETTDVASVSSALSLPSVHGPAKVVPSPPVKPSPPLPTATPAPAKSAPPPPRRPAGGTSDYGDRK